jgi:hypothetical protein
VDNYRPNQKIALVTMKLCFKSIKALKLKASAAILDAERIRFQDHNFSPEYHTYQLLMYGRWSPALHITK